MTTHQVTILPFDMLIRSQKWKLKVIFVLIVSLNRCRWKILFLHTQKCHIELVLKIKSNEDMMDKAWQREYLRQSGDVGHL